MKQIRRLLGSMLESIAYCETHAGKLEVPALLLVSGDDHLIDVEGSKRFFASLPPTRATMTVYEALYHEIFNETSSQRPFNDLDAWLQNQDQWRED
jgi:alpha-beta hydrolase superfamily lysophospholipase